MADLTLPLIGLTVLTGYMLNKNGAAPRGTGRVEPLRNEATGSLVPNSYNVYESDRYAQVEKQVAQAAHQAFDESKDPAHTNRIPVAFNAFTKGMDKLPDLPMFTSLEQAKVQNDNRTADIVTGGATTPNAAAIASQPMFQTIIGGDVVSANVAAVDAATFEAQAPTKPISLLTGLPIETGHANMTPFFGSSVKQNVTTSTGPLIERFTANTSEDGVFIKKQEVRNTNTLQPENIYGSPALTNSIGTDRYIASSFKQNERPVEQQRVSAPIAGTIDTARPQFKTVDDLRVISNQKESYEGRFLAGQQGSVRGVQPPVEKNLPETFHEQFSDRWLVTTGAYIAPKIKEDVELLCTSRPFTSQEYFGNVAMANTGKLPRPVREGHDNSAELLQMVSDVKRRQLDYTSETVRNAALPQQGIADSAKDTFTAYLTQRGNEGSMANAARPSEGGYLTQGDDAKQTMKETTLGPQRTGNLSPLDAKGAVHAHDAGMSQFDVRVTHKQMNLTSHTAQPHAKNNMGYTVTKYTADPTNRQMLSMENYTGNAGAGPNAEATARTNYSNAEISDRQEKLLASRASGPQYFQTPSGVSAVNVQHRENKLFTERVDNRDLIHATMSQVPGGATQFGCARGRQDLSEIPDSRMAVQPSAQLQGNPYHNKGPMNL